MFGDRQAQNRQVPEEQNQQEQRALTDEDKALLRENGINPDDKFVISYVLKHGTADVDAIYRSIKERYEDEEKEESFLRSIRFGHSRLALEILNNHNIRGNVVEKFANKPYVHKRMRNLANLPSVLFCAAKNGHVSIIDYINANFPNIINIEDNKRRTALVYAVKNDHLDAVLALLRNKLCRADAIDAKQQTVLMHAAKKGRHTIFNALIASGKNVAIGATDMEARTAEELMTQHDNAQQQGAADQDQQPNNPAPGL